MARMSADAEYQERAGHHPSVAAAWCLAPGKESSSLVPAVRAIFSRRFDPARIETGAELESIASGLALMGRERDLSRWTTRAPPP